MFLCIDFGNTNVKASVYKDDKELYFYKSTELPIEKIKWITEEYNIQKSIFSSTRSLSQEYIQQINQITHLIQLNKDTKIPVTVGYKTPDTLGSDRIAAIVAAKKMFPDKTVVVIDAGTCITMDVADREGHYHGGNISPGIFMRRQAMHDFTDKLPLVDFQYPDQYIGKSTESALQNGILRGTLYELQSFIELVIEEFGDTQVVLTGGDTKFFEEHLNFTIFASSNLVLKGLNEIIKINE